MSLLKTSTFSSSSSQLNNPAPKTEEVQNYILTNFDFLKQEGGLHQFFSSYDFRDEEAVMVSTWNNILSSLLSEVFSTFALTMGDIKKYTQIKNRIPIGLNNILQELRIEQKFLTQEDLNDPKFYKRNFPELYPPPKNSGFLGTVGAVFTGVKSLIDLAGTTMGCKEEKDDNRQLNYRTDINEKERNNLIPDTTIMIDYELFKNHCNTVLMFLVDKLHDADEDIIAVNEFMKEINKIKDNKEEKQLPGGYTIPFGCVYFDFVINFLQMTKKILIFKVEGKGNQEFIKLLKNNDDSVKEKDKAIAKLIIETNNIEKRIKDIQNKSNNCLENAKKNLKNKRKDLAKKELTKKKFYDKNLENLNNALTMLENQIMDIKNMEDNVNITNALKSGVQVGKELNIDMDEFNDITEDLRDQKDKMEEVNSGLKEFVSEEDKANVDEELNQLMNEQQNSQNEELKFPNANEEIITEGNNLMMEDLIK